MTNELKPELRNTCTSIQDSIIHRAKILINFILRNYNLLLKNIYDFQCDSICRFNKGPIKERVDIFGNLKKVLIVNPLQSSKSNSQITSRNAKNE